MTDKMPDATDQDLAAAPRKRATGAKRAAGAAPGPRKAPARKAVKTVVTAVTTSRRAAAPQPPMSAPSAPSAAEAAPVLEIRRRISERADAARQEAVAVLADIARRRRPMRPTRRTRPYVRSSRNCRPTTPMPCTALLKPAEGAPAARATPTTSSSRTGARASIPTAIACSGATTKSRSTGCRSNCSSSRPGSGATGQRGHPVRRPRRGGQGRHHQAHDGTPESPRRASGRAGKTVRHRTCQWYFQRVQHTCPRPEIVMFDRSCTTRAGVERVMGFCA